MPDDLHEWISFEDPDEERTWVFDVTFLMSSWRCIYGDGCQGVLTGPAPELEQGCCSYGAHFVDEDDEANTLAYAARLTREQWQHHDVGTRKAGPTKRNKAGERKTRLVDGACIFLNRPGFSGGIGCALHSAALAVGERPLDWKPQVCWQLPLRLDDHTADDGHVTSTLREWKRRDWGAGGARVPLVVHRCRRCLRRPSPGLRDHAGRDRGHGRPARLRHLRGAGGDPALRAVPPPPRRAAQGPGPLLGLRSRRRDRRRGPRTCEPAPRSRRPRPRRRRRRRRRAGPARAKRKSGPDCLSLRASSKRRWRPFFTDVSRGSQV